MCNLKFHHILSWHIYFLSILLSCLTLLRILQLQEKYLNSSGKGYVTTKLKCISIYFKRIRTSHIKRILKWEKADKKKGYQCLIQFLGRQHKNSPKLRIVPPLFRSWKLPTPHTRTHTYTHTHKHAHTHIHIHTHTSYISTIRD